MLRTTRSRAGRTEWWAEHWEEGQGESEKPPRSGLVVILGKNEVGTPFLGQEPFLGYLERSAPRG